MFSRFEEHYLSCATSLQPSVSLQDRQMRRFWDLVVLQYPHDVPGSSTNILALSAFSACIDVSLDNGAFLLYFSGRTVSKELRGLRYSIHDVRVTFKY